MKLIDEEMLLTDSELEVLMRGTEKYVDSAEDRGKLYHRHYTNKKLLAKNMVVSSHVEGERLLSVGSGPFIESFYLTKILPDTKYFGVDIDERYVNLSNEVCKKVGIHNVEHSTTSEFKKRYSRSRFDVVLFSTVLGYISSEFDVVKKFFKYWVSFCRKKGKVMVTIPILEGPVDGWDFVFTEENINELFDSCGLKIITFEKIVSKRWFFVVGEFKKRKYIETRDS